MYLWVCLCMEVQDSHVIECLYRVVFDWYFLTECHLLISRLMLNRGRPLN